jgi:hypothetical protein
LYTIGIHE